MSDDRLDALSLQKMRVHAETWHKWADTVEEQQLAANVLALLDELAESERVPKEPQ